MSKLSVAVYSLGLVLFGLLSYLAAQSFNFPGDITISLWLQGRELPFLRPMMVAISYISSLVPAIIIVALLSAGLWFFGRRREPIFIMALTSLATLLAGWLKRLIGRPRPGGAIQALTENSGFSFPSGHIVYAVVFYGFLFYLMPRLIRQPALARVLQTLLILLILLTVVSRVYLGAHWPSDALGSLLLGGLLRTPAIFLYNKVTAKVTK